jgi:hypothetical protein
MAMTADTDAFVVQRIASPDDRMASLVALIANDHDEEDRSPDVVTECVVSLLSQLRHLVKDKQHGVPLQVAVVVEVSPGNTLDRRAYRSALAEAVRGIGQGLAREIGREIRINSVLCEKADEDSLGATLQFLASTRSNFVTGATIDVRPFEGMVTR